MDGSNERRKLNRLLRRPNPVTGKFPSKQKAALLRGSLGRHAKAESSDASCGTNKQALVVSAAVQPPKPQGFHVDLAKICSDMCGVANLSPAAGQALVRHLNKVASLLINNVLRVMEQSLRGVPQPYDVDVASVMVGLEAPFGTGTVNFLPIRTGGRTATASCGPGGKVFYIRPDKEIDIKALLLREPAGVIYDVSLVAHWLAINGRQPTTPQNPPPDFISRMALLNGATAQLLQQGKPGKVDPIRAGKAQQLTPSKSRRSVVGALNTDSLTGLEGDRSSQSQGISAVTVGRRPHQVGQELMVYFRELTEACVGASENKRHEALENVTLDPGLQPILPYLVTFITEGVRVNVTNHNLAILIYLMRLVKALVDNAHISLEPYLHLLVPTVVTCVLSRQLCAKPITDNHWALRDFAAKQLTTLCNRYNSSTNELYNRVTRELARALCQWIDGGSGTTEQQQQVALAHEPSTAPDAPATGPLPSPGASQPTTGKRLRTLGLAVQSMNTLYGLLVALAEFGAQCLRILVFPLLPALCQRLTKLTCVGGEGGSIGHRLSPADQRSFDSLKVMMSNRIASLLADWRIRQNAGTSAEDYRNAYGCMANCLQTASNATRPHPQPLGPLRSGFSTTAVPTTASLLVSSSSSVAVVTTTGPVSRPLLLASSTCSVIKPVNSCVLIGDPDQPSNSDR